MRSWKWGLITWTPFYPRTVNSANDEKRQEINTALAENHTLKELESTSAAVQEDFTSVFPYTSFAGLVAPGDHDKQPKHRLVTDSRTGERLMGLHTTWEFIQQDPRFQEGVLDLEKICNYLREQVQCDGQGPVFVERCVLDAIEASVIGMWQHGLCNNTRSFHRLIMELASVITIVRVSHLLCGS